MHRRRYLTLASAGVVSSLAGCGGRGSTDASETSGDSGRSIDDHPAATNLEVQPRQGTLGGNVVLAFEDPSCSQCRRFHENAVPNIHSNIVEAGAVGKNIQSPLSTVGAVVAQPETQVVLKGPTGEMEPANSPDDVGLTLSEGSPRV